MPGFGDVSIRDQSGRKMVAIRNSVIELIRYMEESCRDPMLAMRTEVEDNVDGDYQDGDLESVAAACTQIKRRLKDLANSFTP